MALGLCKVYHYTIGQILILHRSSSKTVNEMYMATRMAQACKQRSIYTSSKSEWEVCMLYTTVPELEVEHLGIDHF